MFAHHDLVLLYVNPFGREVAIADVEDNGFVMRVCALWRKPIGINLAVVVAVNTQPAIRQADLLALGIEGVTNQNLMTFDIKRDRARKPPLIAKPAALPLSTRPTPRPRN